MAKILVVEAETAVRQVVVQILLSARPDDNIEVADNGYTGLQLLISGSYDLVVTDWRMTRIDGDKMLGRAQASGRAPKCVLVMSGAAELEDVVIRLVTLLPDSYVDLIAKPFDNITLVDKVNRALALYPDEGRGYN